MKISPEVEKILKKPEIQEAINNNDFAYIYDYISKGNLPMESAKEFTKIFILAHLDPIKYMDKIPTGFFYEATLSTYTIPNNIKKIEEYAFMACEDLKSLYIPRSVERIESSSFFLCSNLKDIYFDGPAQLFNMITTNPKLIFGQNIVNISMGTKVHCSNMVLYLS